MNREIPLSPIHDDPLWLVAEMTLIFHQSSMFDDQEKTKWIQRLELLYAPHGRGVPDYDCTTRVLAEATRVALDLAQRNYRDIELALEQSRQREEVI